MSIDMNQILKTKMSPIKELETLSKQVALEGVLLLENKNNVLPLIDKNIAVFGRIQSKYYKSGTGSGGLVNVAEVPSIIDRLLVNPRVKIDLELKNIYDQWVIDNPFDEGSGQWASEPWAQREMPLTKEEINKFSKSNDLAVVIFGRTAGEDRDNFQGKGSYYLSDEEKELLENVSKAFNQTVLIINSGNPIDLSFMDSLKIDGLIFAWHGGMNGAEALVDVLTGYVSPSAKLPFTIAKNIEDYPSNRNFGLKDEVIYEEDIYVGYRYFSTFKNDRVRYEFGFGLTYSYFEINLLEFDVDKTDVYFKIEILNIGEYIAKEVVQIYLEQPQGLLGKPKRVLVGFEKTKGLKPNEKTVIEFNLDLFKMASYDDVGYIYKSSYVLEKGDYRFHIGNSVSNTNPFGLIEIENDIITLVSEELNAPVKSFKRFKPGNKFLLTIEDVPLRTIDYNKRINDEVIKDLPQSNKFYNLLDVYQSKITINEFIGSLSIDEMIELTRGEGMSSPKVTAGTAAAFGGVTEKLLNKGIPIACAADGPSGIRMDSGYYATSLPIGTLLASTFNLNLVEQLYLLTGYEMRNYDIDLLLAPGMNIIRHPLNGRNFEYFSEDPLLSGMMGASVSKGLNKAGVAGTIKHVFANNQETDRFNVNAVISERAQREIYLKGFEIAVMSGNARGIMTSYNPINGLWAASNYDINKKLIHDEWKFDGIIVTDWWAKMNDLNEDGNKENTKAMIKSQNDLYMVIQDSQSNSGNDNSKESYLSGDLKLSHLQIVSKHILNYLLTTPAFYRMHKLEFKNKYIKPETWFKTIKEEPTIPIIKELKINNENIKINPYLHDHSFSNLKTINSIETNVDLIEINNASNHAVISNEENGEINIYYINTKTEDEMKAKFVNDEDLTINKLQKLETNVWEPYFLDFKQEINQNGMLITKNEITSNKLHSNITYYINALKQGKYIIEFKVSSKQENTAQLPFSIYVNNEHKSTLTIHGTLGEEIVTKAFILLSEGKHAITFKFNKSGLKIYEIKFMRHG